jgi:hypothetical protein
LRYELGYRPLEEGAALLFGTVFHAALKAWLEAQSLAIALAALDSWAQKLGPLPWLIARALLYGYDARWSCEELEVLAVEKEFVAPLINPETGAASRTWMMGGKIDAIVRTSRGEVYVLEHKTSGEALDVGSDYWRRLLLDTQISTYMQGARSLGFEPAGVLYDVIGKPQIRPYKATPEADRKYTKPTKKDPVSRLYKDQRAEDETLEEFANRLTDKIAEDPDRYFRRTEVVRLEEDERDAAFDLWQTGRAIAEGARLGRNPRNPDACVRYGRRCEFFDVCTRVASLDDPARFRRTETPHEELERGELNVT